MGVRVLRAGRIRRKASPGNVRCRIVSIPLQNCLLRASAGRQSGSLLSRSPCDGKDQPLVKHIVEILCHPGHFVRPCGRINPSKYDRQLTFPENGWHFWKSESSPLFTHRILKEKTILWKSVPKACRRSAETKPRLSYRRIRWGYSGSATRATLVYPRATPFRMPS